MFEPRHIAMIMYPDANLLDAAGPLQVFASATHHAAALGETLTPAYSISIETLDGRPARTSMGVELAANFDSGTPIDTFLVVGGLGAEAASHDAELVARVAERAAGARRFGSICTGAFLLGAAGLLKGRRATTHWQYCERLAAAYPDAEILDDAVFVSDGPLWTSAGVLAGVDMALAMVERDLGRRMADYTAKQLVAVSRRVSSEPQVSSRLLAQEVEVGRVRDLLQWIADNPGEDLSTVNLARRACMSVRSLHRHFVAEAGVTPASFVEARRLEQAQRLLSLTSQRLEGVARNSGFGSIDALRAAFVRRHGVTPSEFRRRFAHESKQGVR